MRKRSGFTLMEMLIVTAIITILVAIAIPVFSSQLERVRAATCAANCRSLKGVLTTSYMADGTLPDGAKFSANGTDIDLGQVLEQQYVCPDGGTISAVYDAETGVITVSCSRHGKASPTALNVETIATIATQLKNVNYGAMDSGAAGVSNTCQTQKFLNDLNSQGLDLGTTNAVSWQYKPDNNGPFFYWCDVDIQKKAVGSKVPVMRYNFKSGTYTVWIATVESGSTGTSPQSYLLFGAYSGYDPSTKQAAKDQTYNNMVEKYAQAVKDYSA